MDDTMPDTIPGDIVAVPSSLPSPAVPMQEEQPDAQSDHEMDLNPPDTLLDGVALEQNEDSHADDAVKEKSLQKEDSLASTVSMVEPWERDFYDYKEENGKWVKVIKDKYMALAKARNWSLGPIDVNAPVAPPMEKLGTVQIKNAHGDTSDQQPAPTEPMKTSEPEIAAPTSEPKIPVQQPDASAPEQPKQPVVAAPQGPQDRTLELAGLQALMKGQVEREQAASLEEARRVEQLRLLNPGPVAGPPADKIDWVSHKKEGMRLKRLLEESADGAKSYPYMAKMWAGTKEDMVFKHDVFVKFA